MLSVTLGLKSVVHVGLGKLNIVFKYLSSKGFHISDWNVQLLLIIKSPDTNIFNMYGGW